MRNQLIAKIHVAKRQLALDDDTYRDVLERVTGKRSAGDLDERQLELVVAELARRGFTPKRKAKSEEPAKRSDKPHVRKVFALWGELERSGKLRAPSSPRGLRAFVKRMTGVADPEWLDPAKARVVIEALKKWLARDAATSSTSSAPKREEPAAP